MIITEKAIEKIQTLQQEDELESLMAGRGVGGSAPLRIAIRSGGCRGYSYQLFFDFKGIQVEDEVKEFDGLTVVIDPESAAKLEEVILDYSENLQGAGFKFTNPSASTCGCGESFS